MRAAAFVVVVVDDDSFAGLLVAAVVVAYYYILLDRAKARTRPPPALLFLLHRSPSHHTAAKHDHQHYRDAITTSAGVRGAVTDVMSTFSRTSASAGIAAAYIFSSSGAPLYRGRRGGASWPHESCEAIACDMNTVVSPRQWSYGVHCNAFRRQCERWQAHSRR